MGQESIRRVLTIALLTLPLSFACKIWEDVLPTGTVGFTSGVQDPDPRSSHRPLSRTPCPEAR